MSTVPDRTQFNLSGWVELGRALWSCCKTTQRNLHSWYLFKPLCLFSAHESIRLHIAKQWSFTRWAAIRKAWRTATTYEALWSNTNLP